MRIILLVSLLTVASLASRGYSQNPTGGSTEMDVSAYRLDSTHAQVEIDYGILYITLPFSQDKGGWSAPISAKAIILQNGRIVSSQDINQNIRFEGTKEQLKAASATKLVGHIDFAVPYGPNTIAELLWDFKRGGGIGIDSIAKEVAMPDSNTSRIALSGIELASSVEKLTSASSPFEKAGYVVTPNPSSIYGDTYTKLYYYLEVYVPSGMVDPKESVDIVSTISDGSSHAVSSVTRSQVLLNSVIPFIGSLSIDGLMGDSYKLIVEVKRGGNTVAQMVKRFYYQSDMKLSEEPPPAPLAQDRQTVYLGSDISRMSDGQLDDAFDHARYIAHQDEVKKYSKLKELDAKRQFLFDFWISRDKPLDKPLTAYDNYNRRLKEANERFTYLKTPGWKSDFGRVYIVYGPPDREQSIPISTGSKPRTLWEYNNKTWLLQDAGSEETGGLNIISSLPHFIFVPRQGAGKYVLVHSNVQGETSEPNWYSMEALSTH